MPILTTNASTTCQLNATRFTGQCWIAWTWILRLVGWALATLAGYTGIVRRL